MSTSDEPINLKIVVTDEKTDLVKLEFMQGGKLVFWIDLTRERAKDWASKLDYAADMYFEGGEPSCLKPIP
jgi:hypothetical protein